jgi:two-component system, LytTR family, sensor histidine kinase AlgZ
VLYLSAWLPIAVLLTAILARGNELPLIQAAAIAVPMCFFYAFMCLAAWYICRATPLRGAAVPLIASLLASSLFSSGLWVLLGRSWAATLEMIPSFGGLSDRYVGQSAFLFLSGVLLFLLAIAVHYLLLMLEESQAAEKRTLELQVLAREAELRALRAQIDPHFLFNSLNSISALTVPDPAAARRMCILLAEFMRMALVVGGKKQIPFAEELKLTETFLNIEKVRFGRRLIVDYRIDPECADCRVPPLLIQPLVENAVTHGIAPLIDGGTLSVEAHRRGGMIEVVLDNPIDPDAVRNNGTGLGLRNVRERLANIFAEEARVEVEQSETRFRVTLRLPCLNGGTRE